MAIKDFETTENVDRDNKTSGFPGAGATSKKPDDDVKNAHATGDGSYGRNDESLPEEDATSKTESSY